MSDHLQGAQESLPAAISVALQLGAPVPPKDGILTGDRAAVSVKESYRTGTRLRMYMNLAGGKMQSLVPGTADQLAWMDGVFMIGPKRSP